MVRLAIFTLLALLTACSSLPLDGEYSERRDQIYKTIDGENLSGDLYLPQLGKKVPAVVVVHGGAWEKRAGKMESISKDLARSGYAVFNIRYRLAPKHHFPAAVEDVADAVRYLRSHAGELNIGPNKIAGWGYSAGANLVLLAGLDPSTRMRAIVAGGAPSDLTHWERAELAEDFIGGRLAEKRAAFEAASPALRVSQDSPPVFLYHGAWDRLVKVDQMRRMEAALKEKQVRVESYEVPLQGHYWVYAFSQKSVDLGIKFLNRELTP